MRLRNGNVRLVQSGLVASFVGLWHLAAELLPAVRFFVSSPAEVLREGLTLLSGGKILYHIAVTGSEALVGLALGSLSGGVLGLSLWFNPFVERVVRPFVVAAGAFPIFAIAPLMLVWFGVGFSMKAVLAAVAVFFVSLAQASKGAREARRFERVLLAMGASRREVFLKSVIPGSLDWLLNSLRISVGLALLGAFIGEFISSSSGLGYVLLRAASLYAVGKAIAAGLAIALVALAFDWLAGQLELRKAAIAQWLSVRGDLKR